MITWTFVTSRRRMVKRYGYVNGELVYTILAVKHGGPWVLVIDDVTEMGPFENVAGAKKYARAIQALREEEKRESVSASNSSI
jgi:hypothetical protein